MWADLRIGRELRKTSLFQRFVTSAVKMEAARDFEMSKASSSITRRKNPRRLNHRHDQKQILHFYCTEYLFWLLPCLH